MNTREQLDFKIKSKVLMSLNVDVYLCSEVTFARIDCPPTEIC